MLPGIYMPLLPSHLSDFLDAPVPYLAGLPADSEAVARGLDRYEAVIVRLDENRISVPVDSPILPLPSKASKKLLARLKT